MIISDGEAFEATNVNRVYGSRLADEGEPKTSIAERGINEVGVGTQTEVIDQPITYQSVLKRFRECDAIFGCTDNEWSRALLTKFAIYYAVPVFDMGVQIDSVDGTIRTIEGRVTSLLPGAACLFCRRRITPARVTAEADRVTDPARAEALRAEGYAPELEETAPAVIPFTTMVAASAVNEFLHRLVGHLGEDRESTEIIHLFSDTQIRRNKNPSKPDCFCVDPKTIARGDAPLFLNTVWRQE